MGVENRWLRAMPGMRHTETSCSLLCSSLSLADAHTEYLWVDPKLLGTVWLLLSVRMGPRGGGDGYYLVGTVRFYPVHMFFSHKKTVNAI